MKKIVLIIITLIASLSAFSQNIDSTKNQFLVKTKVKQDSIMLRWQPSNDLLWKVANRVGYKIERYTIPKDTSKVWQKKEWNIKPLTEAEWHIKMPNDTIGMILATLAFGKELPIEEKASLNALLQKKQENDNRFFLAMLMASYYPKQAQIMGLGLVDKDIKKGEKYLYKLMANTEIMKLKSDTTSIYVDTEEIDLDPKMPPLLKEEGDSLIHIKFNKKYADKYFTGYYFEKSEDGIQYKRLNKRPFVQIFNKEIKQSEDYIDFVDSLAQNYKKYNYKVIGITPFGELIQTEKPVIGMGKDLKPPTRISNLKAINNNGSQVTLTWNKKINEPDFAGFIVSRSTEMAGPFSPLHRKVLDKTVHEYSDLNASSFEGNYYTVTAIDTAGNAAISLPAFVVMKDSLPPAIPTGLKGNIDSTGIVKITWNKNQEPDLLGYMVYTANQKDHVFTPLTTGFLADEFFADSITLRTLSKKIFFKVVAFDKSRHASPYSEILELKRPDKIPPVPPVFNNFSVADSSATIHWIPSSSEDVVKQILFRKSQGSDWAEIKQLDAKKTSFDDLSVKPKIVYSYALVAVDESNLRSEKSFPISVRPYDSGIRKGVEKIEVKVLDDGQIQVMWAIGNTPNASVLVYRKINKQALTLIENMAANQKKFLDKASQKGTYEYAIKVTYADGGKSILSDYVAVLIK